MEFRGIVRRFAGAGAAVAAAASLLLAGAPGAGAAPAGQDEVSAAASYVNIRHASSRACLGGNSDNQVGLEDCISGYGRHQWENYTPGRFRLRADGLCLASNGAEVFTMKCGTPSSTWRTEGTSPTHIIHAPTGKCLTTNSGAAGKFAFVVLDCSAATRWSIVPAI